MENDQIHNKPNEEKPRRWNESCSQCGSANPENHQYAVCRSCLEKGKESGWYGENW